MVNWFDSSVSSVLLLMATGVYIGALVVALLSRGKQRIFTYVLFVTGGGLLIVSFLIACWHGVLLGVAGGFLIVFLLDACLGCWKWTKWVEKKLEDVEDYLNPVRIVEDCKCEKWTKRAEKYLRESKATLTPAYLLRTTEDRTCARWACDRDRLLWAGDRAVRLPTKKL